MACSCKGNKQLPNKETNKQERKLIEIKQETIEEILGKKTINKEVSKPISKITSK